MPIESLIQIIGNVSLDSCIAVMTFLHLKDIPIDEGRSCITQKERIEKSHNDVIEFMELYKEVHNEFLKKNLSKNSGKIQTVSGNSEFAKKIMDTK